MAILTSHPQSANARKRPELLKPLRYWLDHIQITDDQTARLICRVIPSQCPFERDISVFGKTVHIPALCRINPVYDEIVALRLRALIYLTDICGEDIVS